jgi:hypothetical protein
MSARVKEALFDLIRSMSKSEKRYFKLMASRHTIGEENNYVVLFDFIDKQAVYDEESIFKAFNGEPFLNRFSITKKRLYDHILMSLDAFYTASSPEAQVFRQIHSARILYNKSLYEQARRMLNSAEKQAEKLEDLSLLQKISVLRKKLVENEGYTEGTADRIREIADTDTKRGKQTLYFDHLWKIKSELLYRLRVRGVCRTEEDLDYFRQAIDTLPERKELKTIENQFLYNQIRSISSYAEQSLTESRYWIGENLDLFRMERSRIMEDPTVYVSLLTNAVYIDESLGNRSGANQLLVELRSVPKDLGDQLSEDDQIKIFGSVNSVELGLHIKRGDLEQALAMVPKIQSGLSLNGSKLSPTRRAFLTFKIATAYLGSNMNGDALKWIHRTTNDPELDPSEELLAFSYLIELLIHLELGHRELIPYLLKNTQRYLKSRNKLLGFERTFLNSVSRIAKCTSPVDEKIVWEDLANEIRELKSTGLDKVAMDYFDFHSWALSKAAGRAFRQIIREKDDRLLRNAS